MSQENNMDLIDIYTPTNQRWIFWPTTLKIKQKKHFLCLLYFQGNLNILKTKKVYYPHGMYATLDKGWLRVATITHCQIFSPYS